jgi:hypothetical protein
MSYLVLLERELFNKSSEILRKRCQFHFNNENINNINVAPVTSHWMEVLLVTTVLHLSTKCVVVPEKMCPKNITLGDLHGC